MKKAHRWGWILLVSIGIWSTACVKEGSHREKLSAKGAGKSNEASYSSPAAQPPLKADLKKAAELNAQLALGYLEQGDVARAKVKIMRALRLNSRSPTVQSALGYFYEQIKEQKEAEVAYRKAIRLSRAKDQNEQGPFYNNYGAFLCRLQRYEEAERAFEMALKDKSYPNTGAVYENKGRCALLSGQTTLAKQYLQKALDYEPSSETIRHLIKQIEESSKIP